MQRAGGAYIEIRGEDKRLKGDLDRAHGKVSSSTTKMQSMVTKAFKIMSVAAVAGMAAITATITKSVLSFAPFEVALNRLGNVSDKTIKSMRKEILGLSSQLGSVTNLTKGYYQVMSAGITETDKAMKMLKVSAKMSLEATIQQAETVKGLAATIGAYSDELKTATDAADLLYSIEKSGITSVGELIPLIGNLANLSRAVGLSANEMAAGIAQITTSGAGTSIAVTHMQSLLVALSKQFTQLPPKIQAYGTAIEAVKALGFQGVLKEIMDYTEGNSTVLGKMLGRQEGYLALLQLSKNEFKDYGDRLGGMANKVGAFDDAWKRYSKTLTAIWDTFKNTVGRQAILLGEKLAPKLKEITERMTDWIEKNDELIAQKVPVYVDALITGLTTAASWAEKTAKFMISIKDSMRAVYLLQTGQAGKLFFPEKPETKGPVYFPKDYSITYPSYKPEEVPTIAISTKISTARTEEYYKQLEALAQEKRDSILEIENEETRVFEENLAYRLELKQQYYRDIEAAAQEARDIEEEMEDQKMRMAAEAAAYQKQITEDEVQARLGFYQSMASGIANVFTQIAQAGGKSSEEAFRMYQAFAIAEAIIAANLAAAKVVGQLGILGVPLSAMVWGMAMANVAMIAAAKPPSYDQGGISEKEGLYRTGPIREAHIPIPSGGKIPVKVDSKEKQTINVIMNNPIFQDLETQRQAMVQIASVVAAQVAPGAVVEDYSNDGEIRQMVRGGI